MSDVYNPQVASSFDGFDISNVLSQRNKEIQNSISGFRNQIVNPIKSTISDLQSGIALVKDTDRQIMNKLYTYKSATIDTINDYLGALTGGKISVADFGRVISIRDGFSVDKDELMRMAGQTLGFNISSLRTIKDDLANEFLNELNGMTLGLSDGLFQVDGGRVTIAGDWDKNTGDAVFDFLSSGDTEFRTVRNFSASNAVLNVMVKQNAQIGFVEGYSSFESMYLYQSDYYSALIATIPTLLSKGDIDSLAEILKILDDNSRYSVRSLNPNFVQLVLSNFNLPTGALVEDYDTYKDKLVEIITKIDGTNWMYTTTSLGSVLNIGLVSNISESSKIVLQRVPEYVPVLCASGTIPREKATDNFLRTFPNAVTL